MIPRAKRTTLGSPLILVIIRSMAGRYKIGPILNELPIINQIVPISTFYSIIAKVQSTMGNETKMSLNTDSIEHTMHENCSIKAIAIS